MFPKKVPPSSGIPIGKTRNDTWNCRCTASKIHLFDLRFAFRLGGRETLLKRQAETGQAFPPKFPHRKCWEIAGSIPPIRGRTVTKTVLLLLNRKVSSSFGGSTQPICPPHEKVIIRSWTRRPETYISAISATHFYIQFGGTISLWKFPLLNSVRFPHLNRVPNKHLHVPEMNSAWKMWPFLFGPPWRSWGLQARQTGELWLQISKFQGHHIKNNFRRYA